MTLLDKIQEAIDIVEETVPVYKDIKGSILLDKVNCITLHPKHHWELMEHFQDQLDIRSPLKGVPTDKKGPLYYILNTIPVYMAEGEEEENMCIKHSISIVGIYDQYLDRYILDKTIPVEE